jgi:uncharacterized protein YdaU (DUF1376 family)
MPPSRKDSMKAGLCPDYPVMVNDWLSSTKIALMTPAEEGAFWRLLCHAWNDPGCNLPADDATLAALSRLGSAWKRSGPRIRECFQADPSRPGTIFNSVQRASREAQDRRIQGARDHARAAANSRWHRMPEHSASKAGTVPEGMPKNASSPVSPLPSLLPPLHATEQRVNGGCVPQTQEGDAFGSRGKRQAARAKILDGVPTVATLFEYGRGYGSSGIPEPVCTDFHNMMSRRGWYRPDGALIDWRRSLVRFWRRT